MGQQRNHEFSHIRRTWFTKLKISNIVVQQIHLFQMLGIGNAWLFIRKEKSPSWLISSEK
jgi:hypothetical protein